MELTTKERLIIVEGNMIHIKETTERIEKALLEHVSWEEKKYEDMDKKFSGKYLEKVVSGLDNEINTLPEKFSTRFAGVWTEAWLKATIFTVGGSVMVAAIFKILI